MTRHVHEADVELTGAWLGCDYYKSQQQADFITDSLAETLRSLSSSGKKRVRITVQILELEDL